MDFLNKKSIVIIAIILMTSVTAIAQQGDLSIPSDSNYKYDFSKTRYWPVSFAALLSTEEDQYHIVQDGITLSYKFFRGGDGSIGYAVAPVNLADSSQVTGMSIWISDNLNDERIRVKLYRSRKDGTGSVGLMADIFSPESNITTGAELFQDLSISDGTIDNSNYNYYLEYEVSNNDTSELRYYGGRIRYTVTRVE